MPPTHRVRLEPAGLAFDALADQPLLLSAEAAGVALPSSCRNGTCRTCIQHLRSGDVTYAVPWPGLLGEEKAAGWILPCVALPASDLVIDATGLPAWPAPPAT